MPGPPGYPRAATPEPPVMLAPMRTKHLSITSRVLGVVGAAAGVWLVASVAVFAFPSSDPTTPTDATYFLSSPGGVFGLAHLQDYASGVVVVSRPAGVAKQPRYRICGDPAVVCLRPEPATTQGECEVFAAEAEKRGWHSVTVVSQTSHVARVRLLMKRCFPGTVRVVAVPTESDPAAWLYALGYESLAMVKAALTPGCHDHLPWGD